MPKFPFEASLDEILGNPDPFVDAVFSCLESEFLVMPKGMGFIEYPVFERGYEALKTATAGFTQLTAEKVYPITISEPISIVVLRTMLGFTPPEWAYVTTQRRGVEVTQGHIRTLDRKVRMKPETPLRNGGVSAKRLQALLETACELLQEGVPKVGKDQIHRLDRADTRKGTESIVNLV